MIPAFSIGCTQELLSELEGINRRALKESARGHPGASKLSSSKAPVFDWASLPISLDSPLASPFTSVYRELDHFWGAETRTRLAMRRNPLAFRKLTVDSPRCRLTTVNRLTQTAQMDIVIAGSGMCSSGRIVNYFKAMLSDVRHDVLFVCYQADSAPGRQIQHFDSRSGYVELDGQRYDIRAKVHTIGRYPAHADQPGLVRSFTHMSAWMNEVRLVNVDKPTRRALADALREYMFVRVVMWTSFSRALVRRQQGVRLYHSFVQRLGKSKTLSL
ncbi:hypothetical protein [Pseudomonas tohonis]|uniref:hypothetical protein n=1 Tax=Pseudomonas tohonis TaxID=2725477 RepID=UPI001F3809CF|nr:hypothetical protein [Pseudomonas tohonis]